MTNNNNMNYLATAIKVVLAIITIGYIFTTIVSFLSPEVLLPETMQAMGFDHPKAPTKETMYVVAFLSAVPVLILLYGLMNLYQYINKNSGERELIIFAYALILFALLRVVAEILGTYLMTRNLPTGERVFSLHFDTNEAILILFGLLLLYVAKERFIEE